jgi:hypothetical protein
MGDRHYFQRLTLHPKYQVKGKVRKNNTPRVCKTLWPSLWRTISQDHHAGDFLNECAGSKETSLGVPL